MDMNELFSRHQVALFGAAQLRHNRRGGLPGDIDLSGHYARQIEAYRAARGMTAYFVAARGASD